MNTIYLGGSGCYVSKPAQRCPVPWCASLHEEPGESRYSNVTEFVATYYGNNAGSRHQEIVSVGLDQAKPGAELMVSITVPLGEIWLPLEEAKRLTPLLLQLDWDATHGGAL